MTWRNATSMALRALLLVALLADGAPDQSPGRGVRRQPTLLAVDGRALAEMGAFVRTPSAAHSREQLHLSVSRIPPPSIKTRRHPSSTHSFAGLRLAAHFSKVINSGLTGALRLSGSAAAANVGAVSATVRSWWTKGGVMDTAGGALLALKAYTLWFFFGLLGAHSAPSPLLSSAKEHTERLSRWPRAAGLHHVYLGRPRAALRACLTLNYLGLGWLYDGISLPLRAQALRLSLAPGAAGEGGVDEEGDAAAVDETSREDASLARALAAALCRAAAFCGGAALALLFGALQCVACAWRAQPRDS